jgi:GH43 family beta-xylosidase
MTNRLLAFACFTGLLGCTICPASAQEPIVQPAPPRAQNSEPTADTGHGLVNPIFKGADPWVMYDEGYYYYSAGCPGASICITRSKTVEGLATAPHNAVWSAPPTGPNHADIWAPEIHKVNGKWYVYYCADNGDNNNHRVFVIQSNTDSPLGPYSMGDTGGPNGQMMESNGNWAIDPDVFNGTDGKLYLVWSCTNFKTAQFPQAICLARMRDALHVDGNTVQISSPTEPWEVRGASIEEGPVGYVHDGHNYITYSGSASWTANDYSVGLLTNQEGDLMNPGAWVKSGPIFDNHHTAFGTGSVVFVRGTEPNEYWNMYHGIDRLDCPSAYACRDIRLQKMHFAPDGAPVLGYPYDPGVPFEGENGRYTAWGSAFGDMAEGNPKGAVVHGVWSGKEPDSNESETVGPGWMHTFSQSNPNLENYILSVDMQWIANGETSPYPKYGVYAAYADARYFVTAWINPAAKAVSTYAVIGGNIQPWADCPLPPGFDPAAFNNLRVEKSGIVFTLSLNRVPLTGACTGRSFGLLNGQTGLITEDVRARFKNFTVTQVGTKNLNTHPSQ